MSVILSEALQLERLELNLFRAPVEVGRTTRIFGGRVIAQALMAAYATVEDRLCHSLHAYFIRGGDPAVPIIYEVDRARDGGSFTTRRVIAIQHGQQIFNLAASFQKAETGYEHQIDAPPHTHWSALPGEAAQLAADRLIARDAADKLRKVSEPIEMRFENSPFDVKPEPPYSRIWFRARDPIGPDPQMQQAVLAYASDLMFLPTSMKPHPVRWYSQDALHTASLDHAMWFHRPFDFHKWHLYSQDSPSASGGRGFVRGAFYDEAGTLVASVAQEALIRVPKT